MNSKKGLSPLVATVLLVAIVIIIALLVFWWYGELIENELDKSEITAEQVCVQDVAFDISDVNCTAGPSADERIVSFSVINQGSVRLDSFRIIVDGNKEKTFSQEASRAVEQGVSSKLSVVVDTDDIGTILEIEVIPMISAGETTRHCDEKSQYASITCS